MQKSVYVCECASYNTDKNKQFDKLFLINNSNKMGKEN